MGSSPSARGHMPQVIMRGLAAMMKDRANNGIIAAIIAVFALADGVIHLALDFILFHGVLLGNAFPAGRPGGSVR